MRFYTQIARNDERFGWEAVVLARLSSPANRLLQWGGEAAFEVVGEGRYQL